MHVKVTKFSSLSPPYFWSSKLQTYSTVAATAWKKVLAFTTTTYQCETGFPRQSPKLPPSRSATGLYACESGMSEEGFTFLLIRFFWRLSLVWNEHWI